MASVHVASCLGIISESAPCRARKPFPAMFFALVPSITKPRFDCLGHAQHSCACAKVASHQRVDGDGDKCAGQANTKEIGESGKMGMGRLNGAGGSRAFGQGGDAHSSVTLIFIN